MTRAPRLFSMAAIAVLALAACGGSAATTSSSGAPVASVAPPSEAPASVAAPSEAPAPASASPAAAGPDVNAAAAALEDVDRYALDLTVAGLMQTAAGENSITMSGTVDREQGAYQFDLSGMAGLEALGGSAISFILIGPDAWISTGDGNYIKTPGGASMFSQFTEGLAPETLLGMVPSTALSRMAQVGQEDKNGVPTTHYRVTGADSPGVAEGLGADSTIDVWIADDGGYMVGMVLDGTMDVSGTATPIQMSMDISRINDESIEIEAPN
jgi:hypothetical protein